MSKPREHDDIEVWHISRELLLEQDTALAKGGDLALPEAAALPLVVRDPVRVRFGDRVVSLEEQGLYMFHRRGRLRWDDPDALPTLVDAAHADTSIILFRDDTTALFAGLATLQVHGWVHGGRGIPDWLAQMKTGLVSINCGEIVLIGIHLLESFGYRARLACGLRVRGAYDQRDNGHTLLEYVDPALQRWVLVDLDMHCTFAWDGQPLSLSGMTDCIHHGQAFEMVPLTPPGFAIPDTSGYVLHEAGKTYMTFKFQSEPHRRAWFEQVLEVPILYDEGRPCIWHLDDALAGRASNYSEGTLRLSRAEWLARFYGDLPR